MGKSALPIIQGAVIGAVSGFIKTGTIYGAFVGAIVGAAPRGASMALAPKESEQ